MKERCDWVQSEISKVYHDSEWGIPQHNDQKLFEMLILEGMQAGLSWDTILKRRESMRIAFDNFNASIIVNYDDNKLDELLNNPGVIRNRLKLKALPINARAFLEVQKEYGSFDKYIWRFLDYKPIIHSCNGVIDMPVENENARIMSKELRKKGFKYVGATICYAFMQAVGMVDDHAIWCRWHSRQRNDGYDV